MRAGGQHSTVEGPGRTGEGHHKKNEGPDTKDGQHKKDEGPQLKDDGPQALFGVERRFGEVTALKVTAPSDTKTLSQNSPSLFPHQRAPP